MKIVDFNLIDEIIDIWIILKNDFQILYGKDEKNLDTDFELGPPEKVSSREK